MTNKKSTMKQNNNNNSEKTNFAKKIKKILFISNNCKAIKRCLHKNNLNLFNPLKKFK